jgi:heme exporter protein D
LDTVREFLAMGGYAGFIWPAYGFAAVVLAGLIWVSIREVRRLEAEVAALDALRPRRARRGEAQGTDGDA